MIYFVQAVDGGAIKIGYTADVIARRATLESTYRKRLAVLATMPGGRAEEREIHERFSHLRFGRTEQFRPASDLMAFIGRPLLVGANPDAVESMPSTQPTAVTIKGSLEWRAWLEEAAEHCRTDVAKFIDAAVVEYAKTKGVPRKPPKR